MTWWRFAPVLALALLEITVAAAEIPPETLNQEIKSGIALLDKTYWSPTLNIWFDRPGDDLRAHYDGRLNPPWWPSANAVELLMDYMDASGQHADEERVARLYQLQKHRRERALRVVEELRKRGQWSDKDEERWEKRQAGWDAAKADTGYYSDFQNEYLDDSGWWGVTWLKMYQRTREPRYLRTAETIHAHMAKNWRPENGGGVMWSEDEDKRRANTITNGLFLLLSARLYLETAKNEYLEWAVRSHGWFSDNVIFDGVALVDGPAHTFDYWSYNQGVYIGGLTALYDSTGDSKFLEESLQLVDGVLHKSGLVSADGVFVEKLGTSGDASLFKGIMVRYLGQFRDALRKKGRQLQVADELDQVINRSADAILKHRTPDGMFEVDWHADGKNHESGFNAQVSALTALTTALSRSGYVSRSPSGETNVKKSVGK